MCGGGGEDHTQTMRDNVMLEPIYLFKTGMECMRGGGISRVVGMEGRVGGYIHHNYIHREPGAGVEPEAKGSSHTDQRGEALIYIYILFIF